MEHEISPTREELFAEINKWKQALATTESRAVALSKEVADYKIALSHWKREKEREMYENTTLCEVIDKLIDKLAERK